MKKPLLLVVGIAAVATVGGSTTASAQRPTLNQLARADCIQERREDRAEFRLEHGGVGRAALARCIRKERREAVRDCREERREDPAEYRRDYGSGSAAFVRCQRDQLD